MEKNEAGLDPIFLSLGILCYNQLTFHCKRKIRFGMPKKTDPSDLNFNGFYIIKNLNFQPIPPNSAPLCTSIKNNQS
jgi:hypothetical protein